MLLFGINGSYFTPSGILNQLSSFLIFADPLEDSTPPAKHTLNTAFPPGNYTFYATLVVNTKATNSNEVPQVGTYNYTSNPFKIVNGTNTNCVKYDFPSDQGALTPHVAVFTSSSVRSQMPTFTSNSSGGSSLPNWAEAVFLGGIAGGVVLIFTVLILRQRIRERLRRNRDEDMNTMKGATGPHKGLVQLGVDSVTNDAISVVSSSITICGDGKAE